MMVTISPRLFREDARAETEEWMTYRSNDIAIDEIVASCSGDIRGALRALLLVNEQLEAELARLYAAVGQSGMRERGGGPLH